MIARTALRTIVGATISAAIFVVSPAAAIAEPPRNLARDRLAVEQLSTLGEQLKEVLTPEIGFPEKFVAHWYAAVDTAFARDLLERDVLKEMDVHLDDETREATLAFDATPLGRLSSELLFASAGNSRAEELARQAAARRYVETASAEQNKLFVDLFEAQLGPHLADKVMDVYFRAMKTAAVPVVGADAADQWIAGADPLRKGYVDSYFMSTVSIYRQLPQDQLRELAEALGTTEMVSYAEKSAAVFIGALNAAIDRVEVDYARRLAADR
jgi:hypothetical protein